MFKIKLGVVNNKLIITYDDNDDNNNWNLLLTDSL